MGTRNLILDGENLVDGTNVTIVSDGVSVFSGALTKAVTSGNGDNIGAIHTWAVAAHDQTDAEWTAETPIPSLATDSTISISVVSGSLNSGNIFREWDGSTDGDWCPQPDARKNILIDGEAPADADVTGEVFTLTAGQTLTCVCTVEAIPQNR